MFPICRIYRRQNQQAFSHDYPQESVFLDEIEA